MCACNVCMFVCMHACVSVCMYVNYCAVSKQYHCALCNGSVNFFFLWPSNLEAFMFIPLELLLLCLNAGIAR